MRAFCTEIRFSETPENSNSLPTATAVTSSSRGKCASRATIMCTCEFRTTQREEHYFFEHFQSLLTHTSMQLPLSPPVQRQKSTLGIRIKMHEMKMKDSQKPLLWIKVTRVMLTYKCYLSHMPSIIRLKSLTVRHYRVRAINPSTCNIIY